MTGNRKTRETLAISLSYCSLVNPFSYFMRLSMYTVVACGKKWMVLGSSKEVKISTVYSSIIMTPRWRRLFHKAAVCCFTVAPGASFWSSDMYEPLWVAVVLPYYKHSLWQLGRAPLMVDMGRKLHRLFLECEAAAGHLLCKLCKLPRRLATVSPGVARTVLRMPRSRPLSIGGSA